MKSLYLILLSLGLIYSSPLHAEDATYSDPIGDFIKLTEHQVLAKQFDKLDSTANDIRKTDANCPSGFSKLDTLYQILADCKCGNSSSVITYEDKEQLLQSWLTAQPQSITAHVAMAQLLIRHAYDARGGNYSQKVSQVQWELYSQRINEAIKYLSGLDAKSDPYIYEEYISIAVAGNSPRDNLDKIYADAIKTFPRHFQYYEKYANYLQEKWFGKPGELARYLQSLLTSPGGDDGLVAYAFAAETIIQQTKRDEMAQLTEIDWPVLKKAFQLQKKRFGILDRGWSIPYDMAERYHDVEIATEAVPHLLVAAGADDKNASDQLFLAKAYLNGFGTDKNVNEGLRWLVKLANRGNAASQYELGQYYLNNEPKNYSEALNWSLKAANQGNPKAQCNVGLIYELGGYGVSQDYAEALRWYNIAVQNGNRRAIFNLGNLYYRGLGVPQEKGLARQAMEAASAKGEIDATSWLAQHSNSDQTPENVSVSRNSDVDINEARTLLSQTPYDKPTLAQVKQYIDHALGLDPKNSSALVELAHYYILDSYQEQRFVGNGKFLYSVGTHVPGYLDKAESTLKNALTINPDDADAYILLGTIYYDQSGQENFNASKLKDAEEALKKADSLDHNKDDPDLLLVWSKVLNALKETDASAEKAKQVIKTSTRKSAITEARMYLISYYSDKKDYTPVVDLYQQQMKQDPLDSQIRMFFSIFSRTILHDYEGAIKYAREAITLSNNIGTRSTLALALYDQYADLVVNKGIPSADAQKYYTEAHSIDPHPELQISTLGSFAGEFTLLKWMISQGFSVDAPSENGMTALSYASNSGRTDAAKLLLSLGANPNIVDKSGWTPFLGAVHEGYLDIVKMMLEHGADIKQTVNGQNAIVIAQIADNREMMTFLMDYSNNLRMLEVQRQRK